MEEILNFNMFTSDAFAETDSSDVEDEFQAFLLNAKENFQKLPLRRDDEATEKESLQSFTKGNSNSYTLSKCQTNIVSDLELEDDDLYRDRGASDNELEEDFIKYINALKSGIHSRSNPEVKTLPSKQMIKNQKSSSTTTFPSSKHSSDDILGISSSAQSRHQSTSEIELSFMSRVKSEPSELYQKKYIQYASECFHYFNKKVFADKIPKDTPITWSSSLRTTAGLTKCKKVSSLYSCEIILSRKLLTSFDRLQDTLLHEMCHAAVWIVNKVHNVSHGPLWQIWASRCKLILPHISLPQRCHNYEVARPLKYKCENCSWKFRRQNSKNSRTSCPKCKSEIFLRC